MAVQWRWWEDKQIRSYLLFPDHGCISWLHIQNTNWQIICFLMLKSCCFLFVSQFSAVIQWTQFDEKYMYRVKLHKTIKPVTRMMKTSWAQRQLFNFCSRRLLLAITCSTWDVRTDKHMKEMFSWLLFTASERVPSSGALYDCDSVDLCCCFSPSLHTSVWKWRKVVFMISANIWRRQLPLHAFRTAIRKGHMKMFSPLSPLLHLARVLPELDRVLISSGGAGLLFCSHDEETLKEHYVHPNQSENVSCFHYDCGFLVNYLWLCSASIELQDFVWSSD